jgi:hypothetical protein
LSEHEKNLRGIFEFYSLGDDQEGKTSAGRRLSLQEWECFMHDCHLYDSPHFTRNEAALCFVWSQPFVTDEVLFCMYVHARVHVHVHAHAHAYMLQPSSRTRCSVCMCACTRTYQIIRLINALMLTDYHPQVKRRLKLTHLTFVDFLEVLARAHLTAALTLTAAPTLTAVLTLIATLTQPQP